MPNDTTRFAARVLDWYDRHGRKDLPWKSHDAYRVWISEIMLQQTQLGTVIPYYRRFLRRFPDVRALAGAPLEEVLHLWSGLGYYARARHLHRAARLLVEKHAGRFPDTLEAAMALPGVGRSTAGAILALAFGKRLAILDGNVKRVLARYYGIREPVARAEARLWRLAARNTPARRVADYTQAIMDLGALVCRRTPACGRCPVAAHCRARRFGVAAAIPARTPRTARARREVQMVMLRKGDTVFLERRPPAGIWGGLWSLPECAAGRDVPEHMRQCYGFIVQTAPPWPAVKRSFTHYDLHITPVPAQLLGTVPAVAEAEALWYKFDRTGTLAVAAPVKTLLQRLREHP